MPDMHTALEQAYIQVFESIPGQELLGSFKDCSADYFNVNFELRTKAALTAQRLCEKAQKITRSTSLDLSSPHYTSDDAKLFKAHSLPKRNSPRKHYLKILKFGEPAESYTYLGNQVILSLPLELAYNKDILAVFLLHETSVYFDAKNPLDFFGFMNRKRMNFSQFANWDFELFKKWWNPFISEALQTLRAYQSEMLYLQTHPEMKPYFNESWYRQIKKVSSSEPCAKLVQDFVTQTLFLDNAYVHYRWNSSYINKIHPNAGNFSTDQIKTATLDDLKEFSKVEIALKKGKISLCEILLAPEYSQDGNRYNNGPRPPIKPGDSTFKSSDRSRGSRE
jgi:hypothetical protein